MVKHDLGEGGWFPGAQAKETYICTKNNKIKQKFRRV